MEKLTLDLPTMYGDHHVLEVRRILMEMPGVENVYASSGFGVVEVDYDPEKTNQTDINAKLEQSGYSGDLHVPTEIGITAEGSTSNGNRTFFRHTAVYEQTKQAVSFAQNVSDMGRTLWPCPGLGVLKSMDEES